MVELALDLYTGLLNYCLPIAVVFEVCNLMVGSVLRAAFGGKLWIGK